MSQKYRIINFKDEINSNMRKVIDIIPVSWLVFNDSKPKEEFCKFMPPPYTTKKTNSLKEMVQKCSSPDSSWPTYAIEICGRASKYSDLKFYITSTINM